MKTEAFAENQTVCMGCKRKVDCIYKQARSQNQLEWFTKARSDDEHVFRMLESYSKAGLEAERLNLKRSKWQLSVYKDRWGGGGAYSTAEIEGASGARGLAGCRLRESVRGRRGGAALITSGGQGGRPTGSMIVRVPGEGGERPE